MAENNTKLPSGTKTRISRSNKAVQGTNDSSVRSKWSAATRGYFSDDYLTDICQSEPLQNGRSSCVRAPIINRGYWVRFHAVNHALTSFLDYYSRSNVETQVISLGAGYDSAFFRLTSLGLTRLSSYIEVDFPELLRKKLDLIRKSERLSKFLPSLDGWLPPVDGSSHVVFDSPNYKLIGADLNDLQVFGDVLLSVGVDFTKPTVLLSEVVLVYLNPESSSNVIQWAAERFQDAMFVTYEQVYPNDAFGTFMCRHFKNIGTGLKSITEFPTVSLQVQKYCSLGWEETVASDMNFFFNNVVLPSERVRIDSTELFDEYEEWHLKCAHYVLITAFNGACTSLRDVIWLSSDNSSPILVDSDHRNAESSFRTSRIESNGLLIHSCNGFDLHASSCSAAAAETNTVATECGGLPTQLLNRVYGHSSVRLGENAVLITGGFGLTDIEGSHSRLHSASLVQIDRAVLPIKVELFESMYHTLTSISSREAVLFGGRTSPAKSSADVFLLRLVKSDDGINGVTWKKVETSSDGPCARWRHSAAFTTHNDSPAIVVFGGRSCDRRVLVDCWLLDCTTWHWQEIRGTGEAPCARHAHASNVWKTEVLIICGLGRDQIPLSSIHLLNVTTYEWRRLPVVGSPFFPRYSHTSTVHRDRLILVGGVSLSHEFSPITVIDLTSGAAVNFDLKIPLEAEPMMLHNHSCVCVTEEEEEDGEKIRLMLIGGGGNCFSFGTHLNAFPLTLKV